MGLPCFQQKQVMQINVIGESIITILLQQETETRFPS